MSLDGGIRIDEPAVAVPWDVTQEGLRGLFPGVLRHVTDGYWVAEVRIFGGLACKLGFHFDKATGRLAFLEFFRRHKNLRGVFVS